MGTPAQAAHMLGQRQPAITVIALCFNHARFLWDCLESIRNQTFSNFELIIVDDCSTDDSTRLIQTWISQFDVSCVFLRHDRNIGICASLNEAMTIASGVYISMIATDDLWMLEKLGIQLSEFAALSEDVAVLYSDAYQITEAGQLLESRFIPAHSNQVQPPDGRIFEALAYGNFIPAMTTLIRRQALLAVGLYDERLCFEDYDMWLRLSSTYEFHFSEYVSAKYRIVGNSLTRTVLWTPNIERYASAFLIYSKWLSTERGISPAAAARMQNEALKALRSLRRMDHSRIPALIRDARLPLSARIKFLPSLATSALDLSHAQLEGRLDKLMDLSKYVGKRLRSRLLKSK